MKGQILILTTVWLFLATSLTQACGPEFDTPKNHFDGVNQFGDLSYWQKIGELDLGGGLALPLIINFRSSRESVSPYLGKSWILTPFDVSFVQQDENHFIMNQPNGTMTRFSRGNPGETLLRGQGSWLAEIKGPTITAYANCGWAMQFNRGKLASITTPNNRRIDFLFSGDRVSEIRENGQTVLEVESNLPSNLVVGLMYKGKCIEIESHGKKPSIQKIGEQKYIAKVDAAVSKVVSEVNEVFRFEYNVSSQMEPEFKVNERKMTWDSQTKKIISDSSGSWRYVIPPGASTSTHVPIERISPIGSEYWFKDVVQGREVSRNLDGIATIQSWFTSGILTGKPRELQKTQGGKQLTLARYNYDANGHLVRTTKDGRVIFQKERQQIDSTRQIDVISTYEYASDGQLLRSERNEVDVGSENREPGTTIVSTIESHSDEKEAGLRRAVYSTTWFQPARNQLEPQGRLLVRTTMREKVITSAYQMSPIEFKVTEEHNKGSAVLLKISPDEEEIEILSQRPSQSDNRILLIKSENNEYYIN